MIGLRESLSEKITALNMLVSGVALLLASVAFFAYDLFTVSRQPDYQHLYSGANDRFSRCSTP